MRTVTVTSAIPGSYNQAIAEGWRVVHEKTPWVSGEGRLLLCKDGHPNSISIAYESSSTGYAYSTPQLVDESENVAVEAEDTWSQHYAEFGCAACETKDAPHAGYGLCRTCIKRVSGQMKEAIAA